MMPITPTRYPPPAGARRLIIAEHQEGVRPLPAVYFEGPGIVLTRWHPTDHERRAIAAGADLYLTIATGGQPLQPLAMATKASDLIDDWIDDAD
jgi:hypothetical protein